MLTINTAETLRNELRSLRRQGATIGFVPTMGYLHEGHLSLVRLADKHCTHVFVSIFVNPAQFNDSQDYEKYPIDLARDSKLLAQENVHALFVPGRDTVYGQSNSRDGAFQSWVDVTQLSREHEGACRPGHFRGVSTVVAILFNLLQPDFAVFGEKDFQQLRLIEQMVSDLKFNLSILRAPLVREDDGLAMSSRNVRLSPEARKAALLLSQGLLAAKEEFSKGDRDSARLCRVVHEYLSTSSLIKPEYIKAVDEDRLSELSTIVRPARIILAADVDGVRLIDNIALAEYD